MGKRTVKAVNCICIAASCAIWGILLHSYTYISLFLFLVCGLGLAYLPFSIDKLRKNSIGRILFRIVDVLACGILAITVFLGLDILQSSPDFFSDCSVKTILPLTNDFLKAILHRFLSSLPL